MLYARFQPIRVIQPQNANDRLRCLSASHQQCRQAIINVGFRAVDSNPCSSALLSITALGQEPTFASDWYSAAFNGIDDVEEVASYSFQLSIISYQLCKADD